MARIRVLSLAASVGAPGRSEDQAVARRRAKARCRFAARGVIGRQCMSVFPVDPSGPELEGGVAWAWGQRVRLWITQGVRCLRVLEPNPNSVG